MVTAQELFRAPQSFAQSKFCKIKIKIKVNRDDANKAGTLNRTLVEGAQCIRHIVVYAEKGRSVS
jgi:hypothetical protein